MTRIKTIRSILLVLAIGFVAGIGILLSRHQRPGIRPPRGDDMPAGGTAGVRTTAKGFDFTQTIKDRQVFRIRADRNIGFADNWYQLEGVALTFFGEQGRTYDLTCERATVAVETHEAIVEGNVRLSMGNELWLKTEKLRFDPQRNVLLGQQFVLFKIRQVLGKAKSLSFFVDTDQLVLRDEVWAGIENPSGGGDFSAYANAHRFTFDRRSQLGAFEGGAALVRERDTLYADRITILLAGEDNRLREIAGEGNVRVRFTATGMPPPPRTRVPSPSGSPEDRARHAAAAQEAVLAGRGIDPLKSLGGPGSYTVETDRFQLSLDDAGKDPLRMQLSGSPASLEAQPRGAEEPRRSLRAPRLDADFAGGRLSIVRAQGGVQMAEEGGVPAVSRETRSDSAVFTFAGEQAGMTSATLTGNFEFKDAELSASGAEAAVHPQGRSVRIASAAGHPATLENPQYRLVAEEIEIAGPALAETLTGKRNVRVTVRPAADGEQPVSGVFRNRSEPVYGTSEMLVVRRATGIGTFTNNVRAWQGENVLAAKLLELDRRKRTLKASGQVKTVLYGEAEKEPRGGPIEPTVITANELEYAESERRIVYRNSVVMNREGSEVRASALDVFLDAQNRLDRVVARGGVKVTELAGGRRGEGDQATYKARDKTIDLSGNEAVLTDPKGNRVTGSLITFDLESDTVKVQSGPRGVTETLYTP